jgi:hypothetical protein
VKRKHLRSPGKYRPGRRQVSNDCHTSTFLNFDVRFLATGESRIKRRPTQLDRNSDYRPCRTSCPKN